VSVEGALFQKTREQRGQARNDLHRARTREQGHSHRTDEAKVRYAVWAVCLQQADRDSGAGVRQSKEQGDGSVYVAGEEQSEYAVAAVQLGAQYREDDSCVSV